MSLLPIGQFFKTILGQLRVVNAGYLNQIREGNIPGHDFRSIRGHAHSVGTGDQEVSALATVGFGNWPSAGVVSIVSDNAADAAAGTGARSIVVRGLLKDTWVEDSETVIPTGAVAAVTTKEFARVSEIEVLTSGLVGTTIRSNVGTITASIGGIDIMEIFPAHSTSDAGRFTVPAGKKLFVENVEASAIGNKEATYHIFCRDTNVPDAAFQLRYSWHSKDGGYRPNGKLPVFGEKVDMIIITHAELAGAKASGSVMGWTENA